MKRFLLALFIVVGSLGLKAQWVSIPDSNFGTWLNANGYSACLLGNNTVGWQMDTTCNAVVTTTSVYCSHGSIASIEGIQYFDNLHTLDCSNNYLTVLPTLQNTLSYLYCHQNQLTILPFLPNALIFLYCDHNQLTSLPNLPSSLLVLGCGNNPLNNLPALPNLADLSCSSNQLSSLPTLPNSLVQLFCENNQLPILPTLPNSLQRLYCSGNQFNALPSLPNSLTLLYCNSNQLSNLPTLPNSLADLQCKYNQLSSLPVLPNSLTNLACNGNNLVNLPVLPNSLIDLTCSSNQLANLPLLPSSLNNLACGSNPLTSLPALPNSLTGLDCRFSFQLTYIPELPDSLASFICTTTPNLVCLPELKKIKSFQFDGTIACLPNYPQSNTYSNHPLSTVPLCGLFNNNGCSVFWNISGKVYNDANNNCTDDVNENGFGNFPVKLNNGGVLQQQVYTGSEGFYSFDTNYGNYDYTVDTTGLPVLITCPASGTRTSNITALDSMDFSMDFGMRCKTGFDVGAWSIYDNGFFRPNNNNTVRIHAGDYARFFGASCANVSGQVVITFTGPVTYVGNAGALTPSSVSGNTITYNIANFGNINVLNSFAFVLNTNINAQAGQQVCISVSVTPTAGDNNSANNTLAHFFTIVNSYDPNLKEVSPIGNISTDAQWLTYAIQFQNTGTAEAQHIYIDDTIDAALDASTFQLLAYSHQPLTQVYNLENRVRFSFPNINLPDSTHNEPQSHGYVQYRIKTKPSLSCGTTIGNPAYIYFDFNAPVVTNTPVNTIHYTTTTNLQAGVCNGEGYNFNGNVLSNTGDYSDTLQTASVCDSIVSLHLTVFTKDSTSSSQSICNGESFDFLGQQLNSAGTYSHLLQNSNGCDSVVTLLLWVNSKDSTSSSQSICNGEVFDFFGQQLNSAGTYSHLLQNSNGCDSVVQLSLSILPVYSNQIDTTIEQGNTYTLPSGNTVSVAGIYTDTLQTIEGCDSVVTTTLSVVSDVSSIRNSNAAIRIFPNPANTILNIQTENFNPVLISVFDVNGRKISEQKYTPQIDVSTLTSGIYFIELKGSDAVARKRFVKM